MYFNKFNNQLFREIMPNIYSDLDDSILNSMIALLAYKQFGKSMFEQDGFKFNFCYSEPNGEIEEYRFDEVKSYGASLIIGSNITVSDNKKYADYGYKELNTPQFPINSYLAEENIKSKNSRYEEIGKTFAVYVNEEIKSVILICDHRITSQDLLRFFSLMPKIWYWIYDAEKLSEDEIALFKEMSKKHKNSEWFAPLINKLYPIEMEKVVINRKLVEYSISGIKSKIYDMENEVGSLTNKINRYYDDIMNLLSQKEIKNETLVALKNSLTSGNDSILSFFNNLKEIEVIDIKVDRNPQIQCAIKSTLEYYDKDRYEKIYKNPNAFVNQYRYEDIVKLMHAIFQHNRGKFVVQSEFILKGFSNIQFFKHTEIQGASYDDCMPTPHLGFHRCLGENDSAIIQYLREGQWDFAIYQVVAATKNINFGDSTVVTSLMDYCHQNRTTPFILADNGEKMTVNEFLKYIVKDKKVKNE